VRVGTPGFVGGRLREAREVRGLTAVALAEIAGVSPQAISQYESGRSSPSPEVLESIGAAVNLPTHFFVRPTREGERGTVFYRSMSSATKSARARAERRFSWLRDIVAYLSEFVELPASNFPDLRLPDNPLLLSGNEIEEAAADVRRYWRMGTGPVGNMLLLLENQGAIVAKDQLGADTLDGLSEFAPDEKRPFIIIGTDKGSSARWRFDAAHELGHIVLHSRIDQQLLLKPEHFKQIEDQAHRFGAAFLLPLTSFGEELFAPNLDTFRMLKPKWGVSIAMMIIRARHAGLVSEETERRLWVNYSRRGWRRNEPFDENTDPEEPKLLRRSFEVLLSEGSQSAQDVIARLALAPGDIESLSSLPRGYLQQDFAPATVLKHRGDLRVAPDASAGPGDVIRLPIKPRTE
jgi:Zn-dependent peptidase ImmA (M78 family)/DNA-binding XRE family transcriptional regulator